jgi:hypothetical protein
MNAPTIAPVPSDNSTFLVRITITRANIGGTKDKIDDSIMIPPKMYGSYIDEGLTAIEIYNYEYSTLTTDNRWSKET